MKAFKITALFLVIFSFLFIGCSKNEIDKEALNQNPDEIGIYKNKKPSLEAQFSINHQSNNIENEYCGTPLVVNLTDYNQQIYPNYGEFPGTVTVGNDENNLYVTFASNGVWLLSDYRLYVGPEEEIPGDPPNYLLLEFPYKIYGQHGTGYEFSIPLAELDECFAVVAACNAYYEEINQFVSIVFGKQNSLYPGFHFSYCVQECDEPEPECETAYAYNEDYSICFIDGVNGVSFGNWGWTTPFNEMGEGEEMEFDLYAGAGQCNINAGTLVGNLTLSYFDGTVTVEYQLNDDFTFDETHLYIGENPFPMKNNGQYTVAPGQYPFKDNDAIEWMDDYVKFEVNGYTGPLYIIAHSVVCGDYE
jgi:hypothetical protein